jgi:hypothetical protein
MADSMAIIANVTRISTKVNPDSLFPALMFSLIDNSSKLVDLFHKITGR